MSSPALFTTTAVSAWLTTAVSPRVLHVFERVCNLVDGERRVLSLVAPEIGRGPFSLVVALGNGRFPDFIQADSPVYLQPAELRLRVGALALETRAAELWQARPFWETIPASARQTYLPLFESKLAAFSPDGIVHLNGRFDRFGDGRSEAIAQKAQTAIQLLQQGLESDDLAACQEGARGLAGLGVGLTPAGDDFLLGVIYSLWLTEESSGKGAQAHRIIEVMAEAAERRTTTLSAAWLRAAARGEAGEPWHELAAALRDSGETAPSTPSVSAVSQAIERILATGHTSGADALAGFVFTAKNVMCDG